MTIPIPSLWTRRRVGRVAGFLILAAAGCGGESGQAEASTQMAQAPGAATNEAAPPEEQLFDLAALGHNEGTEETAALAVIEFADFGCIHCFTFHQDSYPALHAEFIAPGDLLWKYIPVTLAGFPNADLAGISVICAADQGMFVAMRDHLFRTSQEWLASTRGEALFIEYAASVGVAADPFRTCLASPEARARLEKNNATARQIGVSGTPTFIVAGTPVQGAPPLPNFQTALRQMIAEARASPVPPAAPPSPGP